MEAMLLELANANVICELQYPGAWGSSEWRCTLQKSSEDGQEDLRVRADGSAPSAAVREAYDKWVRVTKGLPNFSLKQIEHSSSVDLDLPQF